MKTELEALGTGRLGLLAVGAGVSVAGLYYNQPILGAVAQSFGATPDAVGWVPTLTQLGYAAGIIGFAPLGDRLDRRTLIVGKSLGLAVALTVAAVASSLAAFAAASLLIGVLASVAQDFVPAAATLSRPERTGRTVGTVMTGLLLGILLSRVVSGVVAEHAHWRAVYVGAAVSCALIAIASLAWLPRIAPTTRERYGVLLASLVSLAREHPALRRAALAQGLLSVSFSAFWSTLALVLAGAPWHAGPQVAGAFGIIGAVGAGIAPVAGTVADKRGPRAVILAGATLVAASFAAMASWPGSMPVLILGTVTFDLGVQASLIAHQSIVYGLAPQARSRVNAVLISSMFLGMAAGAALGSRAVMLGGQRGVALLAVLSALGAIAVRLWAGGSAALETQRRES